PTAANADQPTGVVISGNLVSGYRVSETVGATGEGFGLVIEGRGHRVVGNTIFDSDIGLQLQAGNPSLNQQDTPYFDRGDASATDAVVSGNAVYSNTIGLRALGPVTGTITANTVYTNTAVGLQVLDEAATGLVAARDNQFCDNGLYGMENRGASSVDATDNWWGAVDGPGPDGAGNSVSAGVSFVPFQTVSPADGPCALASPAPPAGGIYLPIIFRSG
ncbi:MAG: right-handed parallel beta-helix repeat-containing protein, partial [Chloroflexi bacterium]